MTQPYGRFHPATFLVLLFTAFSVACGDATDTTRPMPDADLVRQANGTAMSGVQVVSGAFEPFDLPESFESFRHVQGAVQVQIAEGALQVRATLTGLEPDMSAHAPMAGHMMHIHAGSECGTFGNFRFGPVRIWLDGELETAGAQNLHEARERSGQLRYQASAPLDAVLENGEFADVDELDLTNRVIVVHGTKANFSVPVACAELE